MVIHYVLLAALLLIPLSALCYYFLGMWFLIAGPIAITAIVFAFAYGQSAYSSRERIRKLRSLPIVVLWS